MYKPCERVEHGTIIFTLVGEYRMEIAIPRLVYLPGSPAGLHPPCIKLGGLEIHHIEDMDEFYRAFGYTQDIAKEGTLPDEFLWEEYIRDSAARCTACFQVHIIGYLIKHSAFFREKYGDQHESWIAAHMAAGHSGSTKCITCKMKPGLERDI